MMERTASPYGRPAARAGVSYSDRIERPLTVMVVEDDLAVAGLLRSVINGLPGWGAVVVHEGHDALAVLRYVPVDLLVLDVNLPGISGPQLLDRVGHEFGPAAPPAIFVSAGAIQPDVERALQQGTAHCFVAKPFDLDDLVGAMKAAVRTGEVRSRRQVEPRYAAAAYRWGAA